ncbi:MAG TPA: hypothetical protein VNA14_08570 [Mycobacteriales bacterium]|nr:hypothetical protein [Mycobacteriales bacterium]
MSIQVLVDADNVDTTRVAAVLSALLAAVPPGDLRMTVAGRSAAIEATEWPSYAEVVVAAGWQRADLVLAAAYVPDDRPLVLVSGDGDFGLLVTRHPGPALVVSEAASYRLREGVTVVDPAIDGPDALHRWLDAVS